MQQHGSYYAEVTKLHIIIIIIIIIMKYLLSANLKYIPQLSGL